MPITSATRSRLREHLTGRLSCWRRVAVPLVQTALGALLISAIGTGAWQIAVVVALVTSVAVLLDGRAVINVQAAVSAILMATLYVPGDTGGIDRLFDGLIGAAIGLVIDAVFARSSVCDPAVAFTGTGARGTAS